MTFSLSSTSFLLKHAAYVRKRLSKMTRRGSLLSSFLSCAAKFWGEIRLERPRKQKSNMFDISNLYQYIKHIPKISNMFDIFFWLREANFSPKFRRTREETAEQTALQGIFSQLFPHMCGGLQASYYQRLLAEYLCPLTRNKTAS